MQGDLVLQQAARVRSEFGKSHIVESDIKLLQRQPEDFSAATDPCTLASVLVRRRHESAAAAALIDGRWCKQRQGCGCSNSAVHEIAAAGAQASAAWNWLTESSIRTVLSDAR